MNDLPNLNFQSPAELADVLKHLSGRLGYVNRVAMGESKYVWWYSRMLHAMASLAPLMKDEEVSKEFGDGWGRGTAEDPRALLLAMLDAALHPPS